MLCFSLNEYTSHVVDRRLLFVEQCTWPRYPTTCCLLY